MYSTAKGGEGVNSRGKPHLLCAQQPADWLGSAGGCDQGAV